MRNSTEKNDKVNVGSLSTYVPFAALKLNIFAGRFAQL